MSAPGKLLVLAMFTLVWKHFFTMMQSINQLISSRLITIRLRASPFNITIIQAYAPRSEHSYEEVEDFYEELKEVLDQTPKKDITVVQGD